MCSPLAAQAQISDPTDISGLALWTDANDVNGTASQPTNGASITTWADKSGNGNGLSRQAGNVTFENTGFDATRPALRFPANARMAGPNLFPASTHGEMTFFIVAQSEVATPNFAFALNGTATSGAARVSVHIPWIDNAIYFDVGGTGIPNRLSVTSTNAATETNIYGFLNDAAGGRQQIRLDGALLRSDTSGHTGTVSAGVHLGSFSGNDYNGRFGEIIVYDRALSEPEMARVECYLILKWKPANALASCALTVTNTNDSGVGSLRAAITFANANAAEDDITFDIPGAGPHTILLSTALPALTDAGINIDGSTQTGATCGELVTGTPHDLRIMIDGNSLATPILQPQADEITVTGLSLVRGGSSAIALSNAADNAVISCNYIGMETDGVTKGGNALAADGHGILSSGADTLLIHDNLISSNINANARGIKIDGGSLTVTGNMIGLDESGTNRVANFNGIYSISAALTLGGATPQDRNVISGSMHNGVWLVGTTPTVTIIGNYFGTDITGLLPILNRRAAVQSALTGDILITDNVLSGSNGAVGSDGIGLGGGTQTVTVLRNKIGVGSDGVTAIGNNEDGIHIGSGVTAFIGDGTAANGNIIANNTLDGVVVSGTGQARILGNRIYNNGDEGIDLGSNGVTVNDGGDGDTGANDLLNFPDINTITVDGTTVAYDFDLDVPANTNGYRIEFFRNSNLVTENGQGETYLGFIDTGNHAGGSVNYTGTFTAAVSVSVGHIISATTTRKTASSFDITSEFALNQAAISNLTVINTNDSGAGSLRNAITFANANTSEDAITFTIPGAGPHVITLASQLPQITDDGVSIDGTTQSGASCGDLWAGTPHTLSVQVNSDLSLNRGFQVSADNVSIIGLSLTGFAQAVRSVSAIDNLRLQCNYIGLSPSGAAAANSDAAIAIAGEASNTLIGGLGAGDGNVISSNEFGILTHTGTTGTMIRGNFIGTDPTGLLARPNIDGGITNWSGPATWADITKNLLSGNSGSGIFLGASDIMTGSSGDIIIAGNYIGVDRTGNTALPNGEQGINFETESISGVTIGGTNPADRNVISGNGGDGIRLEVVSDIDILGNYIGVGADGQTPIVNTGLSLNFSSVSNINIGNGTAGGRNLIVSGSLTPNLHVINVNSALSINDNYWNTDFTGNSLISEAIDGIEFQASVTGFDILNNVFGGFSQDAIEFWSSRTASNVTIQGNHIGVGADGTTNISGGDIDNGIRVGTGYTITGLTLGGSGAGEANIIANGSVSGVYIDSAVTGQIIGNEIKGHAGDGIDIRSTSAALAILSNRIVNNGGLGIDLGNDGVTANDSPDSDTGANELLNFPVIKMISAGGTNIGYDVDLDVPANTNGYRIEFFRNSDLVTDHGEGETYLGFFDTGDHAGGLVNYTGTFTAAVSVAQGDTLSSTTTRKTGASSYDITSEFSLNYTSDAATELTASKSVDVFDPTSEGLYALPGNDIISSMTVTNIGNSAADTDSIVIIDAVPPEMTFYNGDMDDGGPATQAVHFTQTGGANLTFTYGSDAAYSDSSSRPADMAGCTYTPSAGYDSNLTYVCFNPKGAMAAGNPDPTFTLQFRARIK
jgi:hypothetical protein